MPIRRRMKPSGEHPEHEELVRDLRTHLQQEAAPGATEQPLILEEAIRGSSRFRVYVLWNRWESVKDEERSAIILEAYQEELGTEKMLNVSLAMGVTPLEAKELGLSFN